RVSNRLDVPSDPRLAFATDVVTPERGHRVNQAAGRIDLEDLALPEDHPRIGRGQLQPGAWLPVRVDAGAEVVLCPDLRVGDRFLEPVRSGANIYLEDFLHRTLQSLRELAERGSPGFGVLAHPPVVDETDRDRVQEMELLAAPAPGHHESGLLEQAQ